MWEIDVGRDLTSPVPVHVRIIPVHKNHIDAETIPILESLVNVGTNHVHAGILIEV